MKDGTLALPRIVWEQQHQVPTCMYSTVSFTSYYVIMIFQVQFVLIKFVILLDPDESLPTPSKFSHVRSREAMAQPTANTELLNASKSHPKLAVVSKNSANSNSHEEQFDSSESHFGLEDLHSNGSLLGTTESDMVSK